MKITLTSLKDIEQTFECDSYEVEDGFLQIHVSKDIFAFNTVAIKCFVASGIKDKEKPVPTKASSSVDS